MTNLKKHKFQQNSKATKLKTQIATKLKHLNTVIELKTQILTKLEKSNYDKT